MKRKQWVSLTAAAAAVAAIILVRPGRTVADPPSNTPIVIGIANPQKIMESIKEYQDIIQQLNLDKKNYESAAADKQNNLKSMQQALTFLKPDSQQYKDQEEKLVNEEIQDEAWSKYTQLELAREEKTKIRGLFQEIEDAVAQVAQKDGMNLVLNDERPKIPDNLDQTEFNTLLAMISQRTILYSDQSRDISGEVITLLDKNYSPH